MTIFKFVQIDLSDGGDLIGEGQCTAFGQKQAAVGVYTSTEVEVRTGEVVAVAVAEDAEFKCGKQGDFDRTRQVDRSAGGSGGGIIC